jgi:NRAMP (natural resistance-associated macrophage protein)-like metal ion transporter
MKLKQLPGKIKYIFTKRTLQKAGDYWKTLGPGLTTGAADDDPSGIATYSQTGAKYGFQLLWLAPLSFPLMAIIQEMCARMGLVTGRGLAANMRLHFPKITLYVCTILLFAANTFNIGADLGAMAKATQLIVPQVSFAVLVFLFAIVSLVLQIFTTYKAYSRYLKYLALILLTYVATSFFISFDAIDVLKSTFIPTIIFSKDQLLLICAILGTTISPYLFFWQTSQEVEEEILKGNTTIQARKLDVDDTCINDMRIDVWSGMFLSNMVMFFIIVVCGATLHQAGITNITTAADAANALRPLAGNAAYMLFALGIIGTGMLAVPVLAGSSSYAISESFKWKTGLYHRLRDAYAFYGVIIVGMLIGLGLNFVGIDPIKALLYSAVANGIIAPIILACIVILSSSKKVMGKRVNKPWVTVLGWIIVALMTVAGMAAIWAMV